MCGVGCGVSEKESGEIFREIKIDVYGKRAEDRDTDEKETDS